MNLVARSTYLGLIGRIARVTGWRPPPNPSPPNPYLEYPVKPVPRYGQGKPPHRRLYEIIDMNRTAYKHTLKSFLDLKEYFVSIPIRRPTNSEEPYWACTWLPALDIVALSSFLIINNPKTYFEIGSGFSTKFARRAISHYGLRTKIVTIDPSPRVEIDSICDNIIYKPVEDVDLGIFDELESGDILFVDSSHRCCMNSDVTVVFLDILPRLRAGVMVEFHDIFLPSDYPLEWKERYYSEQYMLAVYMLAEGNKFDIVLPNFFISFDKELGGILQPFWNEIETDEVIKAGASFWIQTK